LLEHSELIPVIPALDDLSVDDSSDRDPSTAHGPAARRETETIASVSHGGRPSQDNFVADAKDVLDYVVEDAKKDFTITRFKGLGEMNAEQLWDTTMNSDTRTLLQVKLEDAVAAEDIFTTLMGENVEARRKFIEENALEVVNLDI